MLDKHSIGNSEADKLANMAINGVLAEDNVFNKDSDNSNLQIPVPVVYVKNYINISYNHKDSAKKLGAKWDINKKKWYYEDNLKEDIVSSIKELEALSIAEKIVVKEKGIDNVNVEEDNEKVYIKIPFKNKEAVKKLGCRWDAQKKSWYYFANLDKNKVNDIMKLT